jgi:uncharacterized membrane protein
VGRYGNATGGHGFLLSKGAFTTIPDFPGASATGAQGINAEGNIVGFYSNGAVFHGFRLSK